MSHDLAKAYEPGAIEARWAEYWVEEKLFSVATPSPEDAGKPVFTLLLPPPNVTGRLHMGHMLNQTEMDIILRWKRMSGFLTLWVPGTDHAGIATQMMVERQLASEGIKRRDLGREKFIARVWEWRKHYGGAILDQMKRLGASVDWSREYFTMDENLSAAVREVFVRLYEEGFIYRGKYIVNWCPRCMTAISDLEVVHAETPGKLYEIKYPVAETNEFITVATTRPETMLGDAAVAVNAQDDRYRHLHGKKVLLPLMDREIPIILDDLANPEFGTGAVKVTPAHDPNDFQAGLRHHLPQINVMDETARMNENAGAYAGHDRYEARDKILEDLKQRELLAAVKDHTIALGKCDRCKTIVEPRLSEQWFVKVAPLARRAIEAVENGEIAFTPENYAKTYFEWMRNIHDWCISRQLWWGHRIPAWHCQNRDCKQIIVARAEPAKCSKCGGKLEQDTDVLDTWFSSALLPFTVFGWPSRDEETQRNLAAFYPTSLLITGFDILFFWVARMIMMGCHFMKAHPQGSVPFRQVYIHALVRDAERQKMSKTKGNVLDPIQVIEKYGTDAVRFTLAAMASPGTDIAFSEGRTEGYRAFANKIWNAARFIFMNVERAEAAGIWQLSEFQKKPISTGLADLENGTLEDRWILSRFNRISQQTNQALESYRFDDAANGIYQFFWGGFCDWYIEIVKLRLTAGRNSSEEEKNVSRIAYGNLLAIFEASLRLLSPFMPFLTEELWHALYDQKPPLASIALAPFPSAETQFINPQTETEMATLQELIVGVRNLRAAAGVSPKESVRIRMERASSSIEKVLREQNAIIAKLANVSEVYFDQPGGKSTWTTSTPHFDIAMIYEKKIDVVAERERLRKELERMEKERANAANQLANDRFLSKAPAPVVQGLRQRAAELDMLIEKAQQGLAELK